jgi:hypothetical protein
MAISRVLVLLSLGLLGGCATMPAAPSVMALPGSGKSLEQFYADDTACRESAAQRTRATAQGVPFGYYYGAEEPQYWYDTAYLQCMYAKGNRIPGVVTGPPPPSPTTPPPPSGSPPPPGIEPPAPAP